MSSPRRSPNERAVAVADLGAWLLKGNADQVDLVGRFRGDPRITSWCVRPGYRAQLMAAGQRVVFWASGSRGRLRYGVWGVGTVVGPAEPQPAGRLWEVPLDLTIADPAGLVPRQQLRADPRLADAEVFRQPQGANPSFLTVAQFAALGDYLPDAPSTVATATAAAADQAWGRQAAG